MGEDFKLKSLGNMASILNLFSEEDFELGVMDISRKLGVSKSTVHRVLASLENAGLVHKTERQKYTLGFKILELANILSKKLDIQTLAYSHAVKLRDLTDETVALHLYNKNSRMCLFQVESQKELRSTYTEIGKPLPLYLGSAGKSILAYLPEDEITEILTSFDFEASSRIKNDLIKIREQGFAYTVGERTQGIASIAAPLFSANKKIIGSINISGPSIRFTDEVVEKYSKLIIVEAKEISKNLALTMSLK